MSILFCILSFAALVFRAERIPNALRSIIDSAFEWRGAIGGIGGFFVSKSVRTGVMRGLISNEAGAGTSPMADSPTEQGFLGIIEVMIDTVFLCTLTALVILVNYNEVEHFANNSVMMTVGAYSSSLGEWVEPIMCGLVLLFGLATVFCQCFYGKLCLRYITKNKAAELILTFLYGTAALLSAGTPPGDIWGLADLSIGLMTLINLWVLFFDRKRIKKETFRYFNKEM